MPLLHFVWRLLKMQSRSKVHLVTIRPEMYVVLAFAALLLPLGWIFAWVIAAAFHEIFHYFALRICRCSISRIQVGVNGTVMDTMPTTYGKEALCAIAGPLAGFVLLLTARWLPKVAICGFIQSTYNLIPVFPMDGGRVLRSLIRKFIDLSVADRICRWIEILFLCALCYLCLYLSFVASLGPIPIIWIALLIFKNKFINSPCKDRLLRVQ